MIKAYSEISSSFITPLFPEKGETVTLAIAFDRKPERALLRFDSELGLDLTEPMALTGKLNGALLYTAKTKVTFDGTLFRYYFVFFEDGKSYYFSRKGISRNVPARHDRFAVIPSFEAPEWVAGSTCYQVFPDRFFNGDPSCGAKAGEYSFDGGVVTTPEPESIPKPFPESRCLDFYNGDLKGIESKIPYFKAMGVDTLYLNPINCSMTVHRYDAVDYFHVDPKLGGDEALVSLVKALHENGIRLIVDISINHTGSEAVWYKKALSDPESEEARYYCRNEHGIKFWGGVETLPQLNYKAPELRARIWEADDAVLRKFLRPPFSIDGWRFDVAPEVGRAGKDQLSYEVWRGVRKAVKEEDPEAYIVAESWDESSLYLQGDMWDGIMNYYGAARPLRSWMGERDHYLTDGWGHDPQPEAPWDGYELSAALNDALDAVPDQIRYFQLNLFDSHDTPRLHNNPRTMDREIYKGAVLTLYLLPGMPSVYYGDEIQLDGEMGSVEASRYPMCWDEEKWDKDMLSFYTMLGRVRKEKSLGYASTVIEPLDREALCILRIWDGGAYAAVINRGPERVVRLPSFLLPRDNARILYGAEGINGDFEVSLKGKTSALIELS